MISAVVLTKNEEKNIVDCLESLSWCDEIIIVDDNSEDRTAEISKKMGANVFVNDLDGNFSAQRNFGLEKTTGDYILFIDADERISKNLENEILEVISSQNTRTQKMRGFYLRRRDVMWGTELKHGETNDIKLLRLAKRNAGKWEGKVHEEWKIEGKIAVFKNHLEHYPHQSINEFLKEINFYTDLRAKELFEKGVKSNFVSILTHPIAKFLSNYFLKLGLLDGLQGFVFAIMMSFHSFLVRGKTWYLWNRK